MSITIQLPTSFSPWQMFLHADWIVQSVIILLILASMTTWTILIAKSYELGLIHRYLMNTYKSINTTNSLDKIPEHIILTESIVKGFLSEIHLELDQSKQIKNKDGIKARVASRLESTALLYIRQLKVGTELLATISATAPFIGLFGTVWGIMNSFIGIAQSNTTNLAVVAPGIAEALLATALGLVAAIPAVVIYNIFTRKLNAIDEDITNVSESLQQIVSRDLDHREELHQMAQN